MSQSFQIVFNSNPNLGDFVADAKLQLANADGAERLYFETWETENYDWTEWFMRLPEDETVNLFLLNDNKTKLNLHIRGLYIESHKSSFKNSKLYHEAYLTFASIVKIDDKGFEVLEFSKPVESNLDKEWNKDA